MKIIVEGCDNTGKTTLINKLSKDLGLKIISSGGYRSKEEQIAWIKEQALVKENSIYDRFLMISENVYGPLIRGKSNFPDATAMDLREQLYCMDNKAIIIYCRIPEEAIRKTFGEREQMGGVEDNLTKVLHHYDVIMGRIKMMATMTCQVGYWSFNYLEDHYEELKNMIQEEIENECKRF